MHKLRAALERGIRQLAELQRSNGSFEHGSGFAASPFPSAVILACLNQVPGTEYIRRKTAEYLISERDEHWQWNFDSRHGTQIGRFPSDLDDTCYALAALEGFDPHLLPGKALADFVTVLTALETAVGGPYRTWNVPLESPSVWLDIDLVVNSNIAQFLSLRKVMLPRLFEMAEAAIRNDRFESAYYPGECFALYSISRWYNGELRPILADQLLSRLPTVRTNGALATAQLLSAALHLGIDRTVLIPLVDFLLEASWIAEPAYLERIQNNLPTYAESGAITAAFCVQAIQDYMKAPHRQAAVAARRMPYRLETVSTELDASLNRSLQKTWAVEECLPIAGLPARITEAIGSSAKDVSEAFLQLLSEAMLFGWSGYSLADDLSDGEADIGALPATIWLLRNMSARFASCTFEFPEFAREVSAILLLQDVANAWERRVCRLSSGILPEYGEYERLADRSAGYWLGAAGVAYASGFDEAQISGLRRFFRHLTIARQLNDDAHDWETDVRAGRMSSVVTLLLRAIGWTGTTPDLHDLRKLFWMQTIQEVANQILRHASLAKSALLEVPLERPEMLLALLNPSKTAAKQALRERRQTLDFLTQYAR